MAKRIVAGALILIFVFCVACTGEAPDEVDNSADSEDSSPQEDTSAINETVEYGIADEVIPWEEFIVFDGSTATLPLSRALMQYFTGMTGEEAELYVQHNTTDSSYYNLIYGQCDLLLVYEGSASTKEFVEDNEEGVVLEMKPIGYDALVFICNQDNPVNDISTEEVQKIYTGEITNWSELGGNDEEIVAYQRVEDSGSQTMMRKLVMDGLEMTDAPSELRPMAMGGLIDDLLSYGNGGNAIGYSVYYYVQNMYTQPELRLLSIDGVVPSNETIQNGSYPFVNEFYACIRQDEPEDSLARQVYDFLSEDKGKEIIEASGYVSAE